LNGLDSPGPAFCQSTLLREPQHLSSLKLRPWRIVSGVGLQVANHTNIYHFERRIQEFAASYLIERANRIIEIGYGLGFSAKIFLGAHLATYQLIEVNAGVARRAWRRGIPPSSIQTTSWQWWLERARLLEYNGIYFDCFPLQRNFRYEGVQLDQYIRELTAILIAKTRFSGTVVFITMQRGPYFPQLGGGMRATLIRNFHLPLSARSKDRPPCTVCSVWEVALTPK
jgi:hypothetical protein